MIVPPHQAGPPIPTDDLVRDEPTGVTSGSERAIVIAVLIVLAVLVFAALIFPHSPLAAE